MKSIIPDKPIIFWDTCALLDLLRIDRDPEESLTHYRNILDIIAKIDSNEILSIFQKEIIDVEIANNKDNIVSNYKSEIRKLNKSIESYYDLMCEIFPTTESESSVFQISEVHKKFEDIIDNIRTKSISIPRTNEINERAERRVFEYKHPSKKGAIKDSWVLESCIQMRMDQSSRESPCMFVSSNTTDFADNSNKGDFNPDIKINTDSLNIVYSKNINQLYGYLKQKSII